LSGRGQIACCSGVTHLSLTTLAPHCVSKLPPVCSIWLKMVVSRELAVSHFPLDKLGDALINQVDYYD
jgi:hypothetical protein